MIGQSFVHVQQRFLLLQRLCACRGKDKNKVGLRWADSGQIRFPGVSLDGNGEDVTELLLAFMPCEIRAIEVAEVPTPPGEAAKRALFGVSMPLMRGLAAAIRGCVADSDSCW